MRYAIKAISYQPFGASLTSGGVVYYANILRTGIIIRSRDDNSASQSNWDSASILPTREAIFIPMSAQQIIRFVEDHPEVDAEIDRTPPVVTVKVGYTPAELAEIKAFLVGD